MILSRWNRKIYKWLAIDETITENVLTRKGILTVVLAPSFYLIDWLLVGCTATIFAFLKYSGFSDFSIWLIFWVLNVILSGAVILFNDSLKVDITLMHTLRKLTSVVTKKSKRVGIILELIIFSRLLLWDGPDQLLIFFRERIKSKVIQICFFVAASGFQMYIWAKIYALGYEGISDFIRAL